MTRPNLVRLGWSQLAVVSAGLLGVLAVLWVGFAPEWQEFYYRELAIPRLQSRYGFRCGQVRLVRGTTMYYEGKGILSVVPGGEFSRIGVRPGDTPWEYHGGGFTTMYYALETAERGGFAAFDVVNANDWNAGMEGFRRIPVYPRIREVPVSFSYQKELPSPTDALRIVAVQSYLDDTLHELWVWDPIRGGRARLWGFRRFVAGTWSEDGGWVAVTDEDLGSPSRCVVIDARRGTALNLADAFMTEPRPLRRPSSGAGLDCEVFGWVRDDPRRVAVIFRNFGARYGEKWIYNLFFDVTTGRLIAADNR